MAWNPEEVAALLRELADDLMAAEGAARNGYFIELHRVEDNLFRLALENHPDAPPELASRAFDIADPLPAPQVMRELRALGSPLVTREIRPLYRQMNAARNSLVHDLAMERKVISRRQSKAAAELALRLAQQLDPEAELRTRAGRPAPVAVAPPRPDPRWLIAVLAAGLLIGLVVGAILL